MPIFDQSDDDEPTEIQPKKTKTNLLKYAATAVVASIGYMTAA